VLDHTKGQRNVVSSDEKMEDTQNGKKARISNTVVPEAKN
jgi:hypothetical protein